MPTTTPAPRAGTNAYGYIPGQTNEIDPAVLYSTIYPNLSRDLGTAQSNNANLLNGVIPDDTARGVWDKRAAQSAAGGVAGSPFSAGNTAVDLGLKRLDLQQQGQTNLNNMLGTVYNTGVAPAIGLSQENANLAAAPDPALAAAEQQRVYEDQQKKAFEQQQELMLQQFAIQNAQARVTAAQARPNGTPNNDHAATVVGGPYHMLDNWHAYG